MDRVIKRIAVPLAILGWLAGCAADPDTSRPDSAPPPAQTTPSPTTSAVPEEAPLSAYLTTHEQRRIQHNAETILANECMAKLGFPPQPLRPPATKAMLATDSFTYRRYLEASPQDAQQVGYGKSPLILEAEADQEQRLQDAREALSKNFPAGEIPSQYDEALLGTEMSDTPGGCIGEAIKVVRDNTQGPSTDLARRVDRDSWHRSAASPEVRAAFGKWSACMAERGYHYPDPIKASDDLTLTGQAQINVAVADAECKLKVNLTPIWREADFREQRKLIDENFPALEEQRKQQDQILTRAAKILEEHGER